MEMQQRLQRLLPWGIRGKLVLVILEDVLDLIEEHGEHAIALLLAKRIRARDFIEKGARDESERPES